MGSVRKRAYLELLIVAAVWGCASPIIKFTLGGFSPEVFLTYRFFISAVIAVFFFVFLGVKLPKDRNTLLLTLLNGFLISTVGLGLLFLGADKTSSVDSTLISAMAPVTVAIAGVLFLKERVTKRESLGLLIALAGTFITILEPILKGHGGFAGLEGNLLIFASVIISAVTAVLSKKILRTGVEATTVTNLSFIIGFLTMIPFTLPQILDTKFQILTSVPFSYHLGVIYMAVLSGTIAYILWHRAEKSIEVSEVGLFSYLNPVFGVPLSVLWLGEQIGFPFIIGCIVIAIGVVIAEFKKPKRNCLVS